MLPEEGVRAVRVVVSLLVRGAYEDLEVLTEARRLTAAEMARAVAGRDLISPPEEAYQEIEAADVARPDGRAFRVDFPLWTVREQRSDLVLQLTLEQVIEGVWVVEVEGLRSFGP